MIVVTKVDLVDEEWLDVVEEDLRQAIAGTFLADAPVIRVSSVTGEGIDRLRAELDRLPARCASGAPWAHSACRWTGSSPCLGLARW